MTKQEFSRFKKEIKKEDKWFNNCCFYMTCKQEALHTATVALVGNFAYEKLIKRYQNEIKRISNWDNEFSKKEAIEYYETLIKKYQEKLNLFQIPEKEAEYRFNQLKNTAAFKKLSDLKVTINLELLNNCYIARFHY